MITFSRTTTIELDEDELSKLKEILLAVGTYQDIGNLRKATTEFSISLHNKLCDYIRPE